MRDDNICDICGKRCGGYLEWHNHMLWEKQREKVRILLEKKEAFDQANWEAYQRLLNARGRWSKFFNLSPRIPPPPDDYWQYKLIVDDTGKFIGYEKSIYRVEHGNAHQIET